MEIAVSGIFSLFVHSKYQLLLNVISLTFLRNKKKRKVLVTKLRILLRRFKKSSKDSGHFPVSTIELWIIELLILRKSHVFNPFRSNVHLFVKKQKCLNDTRNYKQKLFLEEVKFFFSFFFNTNLLKRKFSLKNCDANVDFRGINIRYFWKSKNNKTTVSGVHYAAGTGLQQLI